MTRHHIIGGLLGAAVAWLVGMVLLPALAGVSLYTVGAF